MQNPLKNKCLLRSRLFFSAFDPHKNLLLRIRRCFATSVFIRVRPIKKQMSASQPLVFFCGLQNKADRFICPPQKALFVFL